MTNTLGLILFSFSLLWVGSGLAVKAITRISHSMRVSSFFVSFFILGLFTSLTEIMVGVNAVIDHQPEIFVGNLLGGSVVIFLLVIPLLAVLGNGIKINHSLTFTNLVTAVFIVGLPALMSLDNKISFTDALVCIVAYIFSIFIQQKNTTILGKLKTIKIGKPAIHQSLVQLVIGVLVVFSGSHILVAQIPTLGIILGVSPFIVSILLVSIGTNVPELSIAIRSILARKKDIAFGNYFGSASLNTLELGILSLLSNKSVPAAGSNFSMLIFFVGLALFLKFAKSKSTISFIEGLILLGCYGIFIFLELNSGPGWVWAK